MLLVIGTITSYNAYGQSTNYGIDYFRDGQNNLIRKGAYTDVEGSPFVFGNYMPGKATGTDGKVYDNIKLNYNVYDDVLLFVYDSADKVMKFANPIKSFTVYAPAPTTFVNNFPTIDKQTNESYYQVLSSNGKTALLKRYSKVINQTKNYDGSETKKFQDITTYYFFKNNNIAKLTKNQNQVINALSDQKEALLSFSKSNAINFKKDEDLAKLFDYYNTL